MEAIATRLHHPQPALPRGGPPSNPFLRFASSPPNFLRSRSRTVASHPLAPVAARGDEDDGDALPNPKQRPNPIGLSPLLFAVTTAAASPQAALALSGGSCGGSDSSSSSSSSEDSTTDSIDWSSSTWSSSKEKKKEGAEATQKLVGIAAAPLKPQPPSDMWLWGGFAMFLAALVVAAKNGWIPDERTSVVKLQIALRGKEMVKPVQKDLNAIAEKVEASNRRWYKFILTETLNTLRGHQSFCISSCLSVVTKDEEDSWKEHFDRISAQERSKFDEETLSNWNGVKQKKTYSMKTDGNKNEYVVVTILVAANGKMNLLVAISSAADLDAVAARLDSTPEGVRVLWTPQDADDVLLEERMRKEYPNLKPLAQ